MHNDKSPGNNGLTKEFYEIFWDDLKEIFVNSVTEKKDRDKRFMKNWRPISLLNVDSKIISKALSEKLKEVLPDLISSQQTAYVKNRHTGERYLI